MFLEQINCRIYFTNGYWLRLVWFDPDLMDIQTTWPLLRRKFNASPFEYFYENEIPRLLMFIQSRTKVRKIKKVFNGL